MDTNGVTDINVCIDNTLEQEKSTTTTASTQQTQQQPHKVIVTDDSVEEEKKVLYKLNENLGLGGVFCLGSPLSFSQKIFRLLIKKISRASKQTSRKRLNNLLQTLKQTSRKRLNNLLQKRFQLRQLLMDWTRKKVSFI